MFSIQTEKGEEIDVTSWVEIMRENVRLKRDITERTPLSKNFDKKYFWWDEEENPILTTVSVNQLFRKIKA